jgi:hypothetical protein
MTWPTKTTAFPPRQHTKMALFATILAVFLRNLPPETDKVEIGRDLLVLTIHGIEGVECAVKTTASS